MHYDLSLTQRAPNQTSLDRHAVNLRLGKQATVGGRDNLVQAILNRLHTRQGELASLGHPDYGSRLHELVGSLNSDRTRRLAELYIRQCLAQETRIAEIVAITFEPPRRDSAQRTTLAATLVVQPVAHWGGEIGLNLTVAL